MEAGTLFALMMRGSLKALIASAHELFASRTGLNGVIPDFFKISRLRGPIPMQKALLHAQEGFFSS